MVYSNDETQAKLEKLNEIDFFFFFFLLGSKKEATTKLSPLGLSFVLVFFSFLFFF